MAEREELETRLKDRENRNGAWLRFFVVVAFWSGAVFCLWEVVALLTETTELLTEVRDLLTPEPIDEQTQCVEVERGEWHEEYGCVLQELNP